MSDTMVKKQVSIEKEREALIKKEFSGLKSIAHVDWNSFNKGTIVKAVYGAGMITNPVFFVIFGGKVLEGKVVKKTTEKLKNGKKETEVHSFSILWNYDKATNKEVKLRTSNIVHDPNGLVANQIFITNGDDQASTG